MPKHDPPSDDAALLERERELMELDRAIRAADEKGEAIDYALFDRRDELMARIFNTPAAGLAGLVVQARGYLSEYEVEFAEGEGEGEGRPVPDVNWPAHINPHQVEQRHQGED